MKPNWQEEFDDLWRLLNDWAGSGFRYSDPNFTKVGLETMKPKFLELLESETKRAYEKGRQKGYEQGFEEGEYTVCDCEEF